MANSNSSWKERQLYAAKNQNQAEDKFIETLKEKGYSSGQYCKYGFDELNPLDHFYLIPPVLRYTPDFVCISKKEKKAFFTEVKSCGKDSQFKVKVEQIPFYYGYNHIMPLHFFIYHIQRNDFLFLSFDQLMYGIEHIGVDHKFDSDGKKAKKLQYDDLCAIVKNDVPVYTNKNLPI